MDAKAVLLMKDELTKSGIIDLEHDINDVVLRQRGKEFGFEEHVRALIYSLLTNQRKWSDVEPKLPHIDRLFFYYDVEKIYAQNADYFEQGIRNLRCGNISIRMQMKGLKENIDVFKRIAKTYGSMDAFVTSNDPYEIVRMISVPGGEYKLKGVGTALAWEYLRNVGIDGAKPDVHMKRFMGANRMGVSLMPEASDDEVFSEVERLSSETGLTKFEIDFIGMACFLASKH